MKAIFLSPILALALSSSLLADGFSLDRALKNEQHLILNLSKTQSETVGQYRRLDLSKEQLLLLRNSGVKSPRVLGVMSQGEADCSCCIAPVYWLDQNRVIIWTDRLKYNKDGGMWYYKVRVEPNRYVIASEDRIYKNGALLSLKDFEQALSAPRENNERIQISLAPDTSEALILKLRSLNKRYQHFSFRI